MLDAPKLYNRFGTRFDYGEYWKWNGIGVIEICDVTVSQPEAIATMAHELGHAATRQCDYESRAHDTATDEWASEACADFYAYKWGFGRFIRTVHKTRALSHHGGLPGQVISCGSERWKITRRFHYRKG